MGRKTAFVKEMILKTLNQHQQTDPPTVQKAVTLDDKVGEIINRKNVNDHDKAKLYSDILQKCMTANYRKHIASSCANYTSVHVQ